MIMEISVFGHTSGISYWHTPGHPIPGYTMHRNQYCDWPISAGGIFRNFSHAEVYCLSNEDCTGYYAVKNHENGAYLWATCKFESIQKYRKGRTLYLKGNLKSIFFMY